MQFLLVPFLLIGTAGASQPPPSDPAPQQAPLLVELFTSQGCYSCPPADTLLRELAKYDELIPLTYHVDYWNHLGWTDPFSSKQWSDRQRAYARILRSDAIYTPQLVIGGTMDEVGSDRVEVLDKIARSIEAGPSRRARTVTLKAQLSSTREDDAIAIATAQAEPAPAGGTALLVVLYERDLSTEIPSGENRNKTLHYDYVVRALKQATNGDPVRFSLEDGWKREDLGVVAFVQDKRSGAILGIDRVREPLSMAP